MEGKIITCCGDCVHYDWKKHKCKNGYNICNQRKHFYSDCKTLEDLEEHDSKVRADAIEPIIKIEEDAIKYGHTDGYELVQIRRYLEQLKEQKQ